MAETRVTKAALGTGIAITRISRVREYLGLSLGPGFAKSTAKPNRREIDVEV
jgi:hypothetical protein